MLFVYRLLGEGGGVESIVQLLQDQESQCRQYSADCVTAMAPDGKQGSVVIDGEGIITCNTTALFYRVSSFRAH